MGGRANEIGLLAAIVLLYAFLAGFAPNFLTLPNQLNILRDAAFVGIIAWGMTLVLIAGEIDISVGPHVAFAGVVLATEADLKEKETAGAGEATDEEVLPDLRNRGVASSCLGTLPLS